MRILERRSTLVVAEAYCVEDISLSFDVGRKLNDTMLSIYASSLDDLRVFADACSLWVCERRDAILRSIVTACLLQLCASDYPSELPTVFLLNTDSLGDFDSSTHGFSGAADTSGQSSFGSNVCSGATIALHTLHAVLIYLRGNGVETTVGEILQTSGLWGSTGCVRHMNPHQKRSAVDTYEAHMQKCRQNIHSIQKDYMQQGRAQASEQIDTKMMFALRCRWSATDAFIADSRILHTLTKNVIAAAQYIREREHIGIAKTIDSNSAARVSPAGELVQSIGTLSLEILAALQRGCFMQQSRNALVDVFKGKLWPSCCFLMSSSSYHQYFGVVSGDNNDRYLFAVRKFIRAWWELVAVGVAKEFDISKFLFCDRYEHTFSAVIPLLKTRTAASTRPLEDASQEVSSKENDSAGAEVQRVQAWSIKACALRTLRSALVYGHSFGFLITWLLGCYTNAPQQSAAIAFPASLSVQAPALELNWILEQAAVSLGAELIKISSNANALSEAVIDSSSSTVIEASTAVLLYVKDHVIYEARTLLDVYFSPSSPMSPAQHLHLSAVLSCVSSVLFAQPPDCAQGEASVDGSESCLISMARAAADVRGAGLMSAVRHFLKWISSIDEGDESFNSGSALVQRLQQTYNRLLREWSQIFAEFLADHSDFENRFQVIADEALQSPSSSSLRWVKSESLLAVQRAVAASFTTLLVSGEMSPQDAAIERAHPSSSSAACSFRHAQFLLMNYASELFAGSVSVSDGLFSWQRLRIARAIWLCSVSSIAQILLFFCRGDENWRDDAIERLLGMVICSADYFRLDSFAFPCISVVYVAIERLINSAQQPPQLSKQQLTDVVYFSTLFEMKGRSLHLHNSEFLSQLHRRMAVLEKSFRIINGTCDCTSIRSAAMDWADQLVGTSADADDDCIKFSAVRRGGEGSGFFDLLLHLEGDLFSHWMHVLTRLYQSQTKETWAAKISADSLVQARVIMRLLQITVSDQAYRWLPPYSPGEGDAMNLDSFLAPVDETVEAYCSLLEGTVVSAVKKTRENSTPLSEAISITAEKDFFSSCAILRSRPNRLGATASSYVPQEGALDLCDKVCTAAICGAVGDSRVHTIALLVMCCCPSVMPWTVRQRAWSYIGPPHNLIHLLEEPAMIEKLLPAIIAPLDGAALSEKSSSLYRTMITVLLHLRHARIDCGFAVTAVAVYQLAQHLLQLARAGTDAAPLIERLLRHICQNELDPHNAIGASDWLLTSIVRVITLNADLLSNMTTNGAELVDAIGLLRGCCVWPGQQSCRQLLLAASEEKLPLDVKFVLDIIVETSLRIGWGDTDA